ncbi:GIN domain-containing protein [Acetobacter cibinongensis]|uniref:Putative auto-transporter adhesin head GIN domain-containing protein n=1 Tax=Acetobacter cibinongensis TaxID=146475 RepID=A0A1Z5YSY6_9PROT|nr:DUF2807 domain-containing protein [Acetobacter cibinongensis]OUJ01335.1 hypothetical protein HK14_09940 [Acetobacter cibinongensis]
MIRGLVFIAVGTALASALCFGVASSRGPMDFTLANIEWGSDSPNAAKGPQITRTLPWQGSHDLTVNIAGTFIIKQGDTPSITVTGPQKTVDDVELNSNSLDFSTPHRTLRRRKVVVTITAPALDTLTLNSFGVVDLQNYTQKTLDLTINGAASVKGTGSVERAKLVIDGAGSVDLSAMDMHELEVEMNGAGSVKAGPTAKANVSIDGAGAVKLTRRPTQFSKQINGAGSISVPDGASTPDHPDHPAPAEKQGDQTEDESSF